MHNTVKRINRTPYTISICSVEKLKNEPNQRPVWVLEISAGAVEHCSARKDPVKLGTVTMLLQPKVLLINGVDRASAAAGRNLLLKFVDLLIRPDADVQNLVKTISIHIIFDANPASSDAECWSASNATRMDPAAEQVLLRFVAEEKFSLILSPSFQSVGVTGLSRFGVKQRHEHQLAATYHRKLDQVTNCSSSTRYESPVLQNVARSFNSCLVLDLGMSCCSHDTTAVLQSHRGAILGLLMASHQGVGGVVTTQFGEPLSSAVRLTSSTGGNEE